MSEFEYKIAFPLQEKLGVLLAEDKMVEHILAIHMLRLQKSVNNY